MTRHAGTFPPSPPCDGCVDRARCAALSLACVAFDRYVTAGKDTRDPMLRLPSADRFDFIEARSECE